MLRDQPKSLEVRVHDRILIDRLRRARVCARPDPESVDPDQTLLQLLGLKGCGEGRAGLYAPIGNETWEALL